MNLVSGKKKLVRDISANTLQTFITQGFGLAIFYLTSRFLLKEEFGEFNWALAVGSTIIAIASLGLDLVFVKRLAAGGDVIVMSGIHFFHTVITGVILSAAAFIIHVFVPSFSQLHPLFFFVFLNLAISNVSNSFKLCLNGLESYNKLALLALIVNCFKLILIFSLYITHRFTIMNVIIVYTVTSALEFVSGYFLVSTQVSKRVVPLLKADAYKYFIMESLPQLGVVVFDSALARIDWILLGILSTAAVTADYSFTYKVFELSKLPLLIVAPILLTRFSRIFASQSNINPKHQSEIQLFFRMEMVIVMLIPLVMLIVWSPLVDFFTNNKYGAVNETKFWILAACIPMMCMINFLWTLGFVQGQLKQIFYITIAVSFFNIAANFLFIPYYQGEGAAAAFLVSTFIQLLLYIKFIRQEQVKLNYVSCIIIFGSAVVALCASRLLTNNIIFATPTAVMIFTLLILITRQFNIQQLKDIFSKETKINSSYNP